ncbi:hypothetical protein HA44_18365 [Mixta gaviniae]|nr:hypothetical protein HA44_18365 [Mixta gaviniae]
MLTHPLLAPEALRQETAVIDAEYRLLRADAQTLGDVAQRSLFSGPPAMHRFTSAMAHALVLTSRRCARRYVPSINSTIMPRR